MKKFLALLFSIILLVGCAASEDYDYTGSYVLLKKGSACNIVVHWEYPNNDITVDTFDIDTTNLKSYIDESLPIDGDGVHLNTLLGSLGYNRSFFSTKPIKISGDNADKIAKKKISIYLSVTDTNGNNYKIKLNYNKAIRD